MSESKTELAIIIPCYNEELVVKSTVETLLKVIDGIVTKGKISENSYIYLIDDGSKDKTWDIIEDLHKKYGSKVKGTKFIRNYGNQKALIAGLLDVKKIGCDCVISIDADLQDDVNAIIEMAEKHAAGAHIVCGVRASRQTDTFLKRNTARAYYKIMQMLGSSLIYDHADFRLMDPDALDALALYHGDDLFLRGLITRLGFKCETVSYDRAERFAGESKYTLKKMLKLAAKGFTSGRMRPMSVAREPYTHTKELIGL